MTAIRSDSTLLFDATHDFDDVLPDSLYEFMRTRYWVCVYRDEADSWCMSLVEPFPVPNPQMKWQRPTWGECLDFQTLKSRRPDLVERRNEKLRENNKRYGRYE